MARAVGPRESCVVSNLCGIDGRVHAVRLLLDFDPAPALCARGIWPRSRQHGARATLDTAPGQSAPFGDQRARQHGRGPPSGCAPHPKRLEAQASCMWFLGRRFSQARGDGSGLWARGESARGAATYVRAGFSPHSPRGCARRLAKTRAKTRVVHHLPSASDTDQDASF